MRNYKLFIALILIVVMLFICLPKIYGQDGRSRIDVKQAYLSLPAPKIILPDVDLSGLTFAKIDTTLLKQQLEIISAKRKELAEFERHFRSLLKLQRGSK